MKWLVALTVSSMTAAGWAASTARPTTQPASKDKPAASKPAPAKFAAGADTEGVINTLLPPRPEEPLVPIPNEPRTFDPQPPATNVVGVAPLREGTFLVDRFGQISKQADGQQQFEFIADGKATAEQSVLLLPNLNLMQMETALKKAGGQLRFSVTGEVTEYNGRNYMLIRSTGRPTANKGPAPVVPPPVAPATGADAEAVLNALLPPRPAEPLLPTPKEPRTFDVQPVAPGPGSVALLREGKSIVDRLGRLTKQPDGQQQFEFVSDGKGLGEPPVLALQNLNLMQMEDALKKASGHLRFRITGEVTEYNGRNYILIKKFVIPDSNNPLRPMPKLYDFSEAK